VSKVAFSPNKQEVLVKRTTVPKPEHGSIDWLKLRHRDETGWPVVTASEAAAVHAEHRFKTKYGLAVDKLAAEPEVTETNRAMERGNRLEPVILQWVADEIADDVYTPEVMYKCESGGAVMMATLDGVVGNEQHPDLVVEIKTYNRTFDVDSDLEGYGPLPAYWYWQGVHQAVCAGVDQVLWGVFDATLDLKLYTQHVSETEKGRHIARVADFCRHLAVGIIPDEWEKTYEDVAKASPVGDTPADLTGHESLIAQLAAVQAEKKQLSDREDELKTELAMALDGATVGQVAGNTVVTWKQQSRQSFDAKRFAAEHPDLHKQYQTSTSFRVLRLAGGSK
jgi:predicted phage-related endonuclease